MTGLRPLKSVPELSIGIPVFNGERYISQAIESLLGQTFSNFELIVSDNASTDGTRDICHALARRDSRVRYIRQEVNLGAPRNWNVVALEAVGKFFKWSSASDVSPPYALARCVEVLRADPSVVLCYGHTRFIDENGQILEGDGESDIDVGDAQPSARFARVCAELTRNNAQCGVFRRDALKQTRLDRLYPSGDLALMAELALYGKFKLLPDVLLLRRLSRDTFTFMQTALELQRIYDPHARRPMKLIRLRRHIDHLESIARAPIPIREKLRTFKIALKLVRWDRVRLGKELLSLLRPYDAVGNDR
jgi:glycosyltransferase involved in cell wall biosynthesis